MVSHVKSYAHVRSSTPVNLDMPASSTLAPKEAHAIYHTLQNRVPFFPLAQEKVLDPLLNVTPKKIETIVDIAAVSEPEGDTVRTVSIRRIVNAKEFLAHTPSYKQRFAAAFHVFGGYSSSGILSLLASDQFMRDAIATGSTTHFAVGRYSCNLWNGSKEKFSDHPLIIIPGLQSGYNPIITNFEHAHAYRG